MKVAIIMSKVTITTLPRNAYIHIDKITITGPCTHKPIGKVFFGYDESVGFVPAGSRPKMKQLKNGADKAFIHSTDVENEDVAYKLEIQVCPPKALQKHNVFGHSDIVDYIYAVFDPRWPLQTPPLMVTQTPPGRTVEIVMQFGLRMSCLRVKRRAVKWTVE